MGGWGVRKLGGWDLGILGCKKVIRLFGYEVIGGESILFDLGNQDRWMISKDTDYAEEPEARSSYPLVWYYFGTALHLDWYYFASRVMLLCK